MTTNEFTIMNAAFVFAAVFGIYAIATWRQDFYAVGRKVYRKASQTVTLARWRVAYTWKKLKSLA